MAYIIKDNKKDYTPAPEGLHQAVCIDVVELGLVTTQYKGEPYTRRCSEIRWVIEAVDPKTGKQHMLLRRFTESLSTKGHLRPFLESWRGKKFTSEELNGFDIDKLVGANCQIQVIHNLASDGTTYANVQAVVPIHKNAARMAAPSDYIRVKDRDKEYSSNGHGEAGAVEEEYVPF
jgi:hypothetical protein